MAETHIDNLLDGHKEIKETLAGLQKGAWGLALAIAGWALVQVYDKVVSPHPSTPPPAVSQKG